MPRRSRSNRSASCVSREDCERAMGKIDVALWGPDGRGGIVSDISTMKGDISEIKKFMNGQQNEEQKKGRDWRLLGFVVAGSIISGVVVAAASFLIHFLH